MISFATVKESTTVTASVSLTLSSEVLILVTAVCPVVPEMVTSSGVTPSVKRTAVPVGAVVRKGYQTLIGMLEQWFLVKNKGR